jgi:hypothetical protein
MIKPKRRVILNNYTNKISDYKLKRWCSRPIRNSIKSFYIMPIQNLDELILFGSIRFRKSNHDQT